MARDSHKKVRMTGRKKRCDNCGHMHREVNRKDWVCMAIKTRRQQGLEHGCACMGFMVAGKLVGK